MALTRWRDITDKHHGLKASVSAKSTPTHPLRGEGPFVGYISCPKPDVVPILQSDDMLHSFAWYWEVEFIEPTPRSH